MKALHKCLVLLVLASLPALAQVSHVKVITQTTASTGQSMTFTLQATNTNDAVTVFVGCNNNSATPPSTVTVSATAWSFTQISPIFGASSDWAASFGAIAPNTSSVTATVTWNTTGGTCNGFLNSLADEFTGNDTSGGTTTFDAHNQTSSGTACVLSVTPANANDGVWFACNDSSTAVSGGYSAGANDGASDLAEWRILVGGSGVAQTSSYSGSLGTFAIAGMTIKPAGGAAAQPGSNKQQKLQQIDPGSAFL